MSAAFVGIATEMGEFLSRFRPHDIDQLLRRHGFGETVDFGPEDARIRYFEGLADALRSGPVRHADRVGSSARRGRQSASGIYL